MNRHRSLLWRAPGGPNEVWSFGDEAYRVICEQLGLRERLRPYVMDVMAAASRTGLPPMRALFLEFPDEPEAWQITDQYMFGPDVLVAPVTTYGAREREVYLPAGASWLDAWTGEPVTNNGLDDRCRRRSSGYPSTCAREER